MVLGPKSLRALALLFFIGVSCLGGYNEGQLDATWGFVAAAVIGVAGSIGGAAISAKGAKSSAKAQLAANEADFQKYLTSRGAYDDPTRLPLYTGMLERDLSRDATALYNATNQGTPEQRLAAMRNTVAQFQPAFAAGNQLVADVASGDQGRRQAGEAEPVYAARSALAGAQMEGILEGVQAQINRIKAEQARSGFVGSGQLARNQTLAATIQGRQAAGSAMANADYQNALQAQAIRDAAWEQQFRMLDQPAARAQQAAEFAYLPESLEYARFNRSLEPFKFFDIGVGTPPGSGQSSSASGAFASALGPLVSQTGKSLTDYYLAQDLMKKNEASRAATNTGYNAPNATGWIAANYPAESAAPLYGPGY